jgi:hypothetical protein
MPAALARRQIERQPLAPRQDCRTLDHIRHFARIAGPVIGQRARDCVAGAMFSRRQHRVRSKGGPSGRARKTSIGPRSEWTIIGETVLADAIFALEADNDDTPSALQIVSADLGLDASFNADNATISGAPR